MSGALALPPVESSGRVRACWHATPERSECGGVARRCRRRSSAVAIGSASLPGGPDERSGPAHLGSASVVVDAVASLLHRASVEPGWTGREASTVLGCASAGADSLSLVQPTRLDTSEALGGAT